MVIVILFCSAATESAAVHEATTALSYVHTPWFFLQIVYFQNDLFSTESHFGFKMER